jgi:hypothetical protein
MDKNNSQWCNLPKLGELQGAKRSLAVRENSLTLVEIALVNTSLCSPVTTLENSLDDTRQVRQFIGTPNAE